VLDALDGGAPSLLVENTGGCQSRLVGWTGTELVFQSLCTHQGL